jgi:DNA repair exonuclease SbcCD ATPase subunit
MDYNTSQLLIKAAKSLKYETDWLIENYKEIEKAKNKYYECYLKDIEEFRDMYTKALSKEKQKVKKLESENNKLETALEEILKIKDN